MFCNEVCWCGRRVVINRDFAWGVAPFARSQEDYMKRGFLPLLILLFAIPCWPKAFAQSPMPEIKPGKNSVAIRGQRQKLYFYPGAGAAPHQLRKQSRWILRRLATGNAMDQTT